MSDQSSKNPGNVAGGLKATLKNPNVSEEAKQNAQERLDDLEQGAGTEEVASNTATGGMGGIGHVIGGHKANIKNPNTSEEAKDRSRDFIREHNADPNSEFVE